MAHMRVNSNTWHSSISTNPMAWQHFQQVMNVEELTFMVANLVLLRIHLRVRLRVRLRVHLRVLNFQQV